MSEDIVVTVSPQVVVVEVADPNTLATAADAAQTAADRIQTGLDVIAANDSAATATAQAAIATNKAESIRVDAATFATIPTLTTSCFVFVAADETNGGLPTVYFYDGSGLQWLPSVEV